MGVLNVTPDSFSDGGLWTEPTAAVEHALSMFAAGADIVDLGAESTRPGGADYGDGARELGAQEELDRLLPVLEQLRPLTDRPISVDTRKGAVARGALAAGADLINDIASLTDPDLVAAVAEAGCPVVSMHSRGELASMQSDTHYDDLFGEVVSSLDRSVERAVTAGIERHQVAVDPGIGFGKDAQQNLELLAGFDRLHDLDCPILIGASRKSFIGHVTGAAVAERLSGSLAAAAWALAGGAHILRVHDVVETQQFVSVWRAIESAQEVTSGALSR